MTEFDITHASGEADFADIRQLCWAYRAVLSSLGCADAEAVLHLYDEASFAALMAELPQKHAAPGGGAVLARLDGRPVGCGMFQSHAPDVAEIKRVYVSDTARGHGAGRAIMGALIDLCRARGFERIVMDTGAALHAAIALYDSLGFQRRGPYGDLPDEIASRLVFFEMAL